MSSYGLWLSAAGMKVQDHRQSLIANNMANAETTGFKKDLAVIRQRAIESREDAGGTARMHPVLDGLPGGINIRPAYQSFAQGEIEQTGRALDVAILGEGFFSVASGDETRYTRDGEFALSADGDLILAAGNGRWKVLDEGGSTITIDPQGEKPGIYGDGTIRQGQDVVAKLGLFTTDDKQSLRKVGENLFDAGELDMVPIEGRFEPGAREGSNVDVMPELVNMIEASRAYQLNANLLRMQDEMTGRVIQSVGRVA
ncbi:MAG: flagellar hook-basal body protein [Planctomycetes bacterium]|nr:flagellar hook-basal body protein [Planctomycetota bacterium]